MTYFDNRAARLHGLLNDVRDAPDDARDFAWFEKRDDLKRLGVAPDVIDNFDARDTRALDDHIARVQAATRPFGHDEANGEEIQPYEVAQNGSIAGFRPGNGVRNLEGLRRQQAEFRGRPYPPTPRATGPGGFYGDIGFGPGVGFNLHIDREGVVPSVGLGMFGTAKIGYATDRQALWDARDNDRAFGGVTIDGFPVGGEVRYRTTPKGIGFNGAAVSAGPAQIGVNRDFDPYGGVVLNRRPGSATLSSSPGRTYEFGFEGGAGLMKTLKTGRWGGRRR